jgi:hypothetical protein
MKLGWILIAAVALTALGAGDADAAKKRRVIYQKQCTLLDFFDPSCPVMRPNGASPPVIVRGEYIGQDPDPFIRLMLQREGELGYHRYR